jgi:hypothetical protein
LISRAKHIMGHFERETERERERGEKEKEKEKEKTEKERKKGGAIVLLNRLGQNKKSTNYT